MHSMAIGKRNFVSRNEPQRCNTFCYNTFKIFNQLFHGLPLLGLALARYPWRLVCISCGGRWNAKVVVSLHLMSSSHTHVSLHFQSQQHWKGLLHSKWDMYIKYLLIHLLWKVGVQSHPKLPISKRWETLVSGLRRRQCHCVHLVCPLCAHLSAPICAQAPGRALTCLLHEVPHLKMEIDQVPQRSSDEYLFPSVNIR